jgi:hyperpolarization activated cyclic nucleotide-gated potassium channel 2
MVVLLLYTAFVVPYKISFIDDDPMGLKLFDYLVDILFAFDIFVNFITAYDDVERGIPVRNPRMIASNYLKSWFIMDLLACLPIELIMILAGAGAEDSSNPSAGGEQLKVARLMRLYRLYRLVRLLRMVKILKVASSSMRVVVEYLEMNQNATRLLKLFAVLLWLIHIFACCWYFTAKMQDFDSGTWVYRYGYMESTQGELYTLSFYWAVQTVTTVGFGDICSNTTSEFMTCMAWQLIGVLTYGYIVANITNLMAELDDAKASLESRLNTCKNYGETIKLPKNLRLQMENFVNRDSSVQKTLNDQATLVAELPPSLRREVLDFQKQDMVENLTFF